MFKLYRFYFKYFCPAMLSKPNIRPSAVASLPYQSTSKLISLPSSLTYNTLSQKIIRRFVPLNSPSSSDRRQDLAMAFTFAAFSYIAALIIDAFLLFFSIFHVSWDWFDWLGCYNKNCSCYRLLLSMSLKPITKTPSINATV